jgi:hypothetical protein
VWRQELNRKEKKASKKKLAIPRTKQEWESHYEQLAKFYESEDSLEVLKASEAVFNEWNNPLDSDYDRI